MQRFAWARLCLSIAVLMSSTAEAVVYSPGEHGVSDRGAAVYSIPLSLPPGAAGVQPKLALQYNSQSGNGAFGVGVFLQGQSSITRCPRTPAQDGTRGGVNHDNNDRLCLDGRRLMVVSGSYGADGAEYRFEQDDFSRVVAKGAMGSSASWFEVTQRDGTIRQYGASSDSRIEAQGTSIVAIWALYRTINTSGNYIEWRYTKFSDTGDWYPASILYTGKIANSAGGALAPFAEVRFLTYSGSDTSESRPDQIPQYRAGSKTQLTRRVRKIQTYAEGGLVREYRIDYDQSPTSKRSRVTQLTECGADGSCLLPTTLQWAQSGSAAYSFEKMAENARPFAFNDNPYISIDYKGVGRASILDHDGENIQIKSAIQGSLQQQYNLVSGIWDLDTGNRFFVADFNGDGISDILFRQGYSYSLGLCLGLNEGGFSCGMSGLPGVSVFDSWDDDDGNGSHSNLIFNRFFVMDVNGDGKADLVNRDPGGVFRFYSFGASGFEEIAAAFGSGYPDWAIMGSGESKSHFNISDFNGDGFPDLVMFDGGGSVGVAYGHGTYYDPIVYVGSVPETASYLIPKVLRGDINGDGINDYIYFNEVFGPLSVISTGKTLFVAGQSGDMCPGQGVYAGCVYVDVVDVNRDGRDDIVAINRITGELAVWISNGVTFDKAAAFTTGINQNVPRDATYADLDGDGAAEFIIRRELDTQAWRLTENWPDVVRTITDGTGQRVIFDYEYLSYSNAGNFYEKDAIPAFPLISLQYPSLVVKAVTETNIEPGRCWSIGPLSQCSAAVVRTEPNPTTRSTRYRYGGLRADLASGRGSQGFRWIEATQEQTGIVTTTEYEQSFPLTGLSKSVSQRAAGYGNGGLLKQVSNTNSATALGSGRYFTYLAESTENTWDLNGTAWPGKTLANIYDCTSSVSCYGNLVQTTSSATDGYSETRNITYRNDTATNILGLPTRVEVTRTAP